jgi:hypothetical protein
MMKKYSKILSCHIGTERPTNEYCEQLEAENARLREAFKPLLDRALPHQWRGTIEIQCTKDEFLEASKAIENAT